ncbi:hypothetical protein SISSUDRAFT_1035118 [Sistotremastrum suecicum HHB10207 ss-3]|uniref:Uncharacterized protein n=1 Tax=Sistotremastrum suecicum HHB10207 ss-3 TaxID=1314776 RepID=A0A166B6Z0_9AGAM|nr:hypothetical protein SISSUDRAFT_1035118 [Sistotremastrum suecicum HHB10207 ss-3]
MSSSDYSRSPPAFLAKARVVPSLSVQWLDMNEPVQIASSLETTPFLAIVFSFPPNTNPDWVDTILSITNKEPSEHYTTLDASFYRSLPSSSPILSWPDGLFVSFKAIDGFRLHDATVGLPIEPAMAQSLWSSYRDWRNAQEAEMLSETASSGSCSRSSESQMNNDAVSGNSDNVSEVASDWTSFSDIGPTDLLRPTFLELFTFEYSSVSNEDLVCPSLCRIEEEIRAIQTITKSYITRGVPLTISWIEKSECAEIGPAADFRSLAVEQLADPPSLNIEFKDLLSFPVKYPQKQTFVETQSEEEPFELFPEFYAPLRFAQRPGSEALINPVPEKDLRVIFVDVLDLLMVRNECIISVVRSILEHQHVLWDDQSIFSLYLEAESFIFSETEEPPNLRELIKSTLQRVAYVTGFNPSAQRYDDMTEVLLASPTDLEVMQDLKSLKEKGIRVVGVRNMDEHSFDLVVPKSHMDFDATISHSTSDACHKVLEQLSVPASQCLLISRNFYRDLEPVFSDIPVAWISEGVSNYVEDALLDGGLQPAVTASTWTQLWTILAL